MSVLELTSDQYHADDTGPGDPSLSSSIARRLLNQTPAHAKAAHPRLADIPVQRKDSAAMVMGTAVHQILLKDDRIEVLDFADFRTKAAQEARDETIALGRTPMLAHLWDRANETADAIREACSSLKPVPFTAGQPEVTIVWDENGARCRARLDWLRDDHTIIWDLKCTSRSADPRTFERQLWSLGYDVQAAFYVRAVEAAFHVTPTFEWIVAETDPPYGVTRHSLSAEAMYQAGAKVDMAIQVWNDCLKTDRWPGYDDGLNVVHPPAWMRAPENADAWADVELLEVPF